MSRKPYAVVVFAFCVLMLWAAGGKADDNKYVGSKACAECHDEQYSNFEKFAKKAHSHESVQRMASKLTEAELKECFHCHTTGYGKPGGFVSIEKTPDLADAGCEVCHGPGYNHIENGGDTEMIKNPTLEDCDICHSKERIASFDFKPLLHGGAH